MRVRLIADSTELAAKLQARVSTAIQVLVDDGSCPQVQLDKGSCTVYACVTRCTAAAEAAIRHVRSGGERNLLCCARIHQQAVSYRPAAP